MALRIFWAFFFFSTVQVIYTTLYYTILYHTYYTILYYTILYYTILYYTIPYYTILYDTILNYTILYYIYKYTIYYQYGGVHIYIYIYSICTPPQYLTCGRIETIHECLETRSDKPISSNSLCDLASFILKNNYFENEELKYHQKKRFCYWDQVRSSIL